MRYVPCLISFYDEGNRVTVRRLLPSSFVPNVLTEIRPGVDHYIKLHLARMLGRNLYKNPRYIDPTGLSISKIP